MDGNLVVQERDFSDVIEQELPLVPRVGACCEARPSTRAIPHDGSFDFAPLVQERRVAAQLRCPLAQCFHDAVEFAVLRHVAITGEVAREVDVNDALLLHFEVRKAAINGPEFFLDALPGVSLVFLEVVHALAEPFGGKHDLLDCSEDTIFKEGSLNLRIAAPLNVGMLGVQTAALGPAALIGMAVDDAHWSFGLAALPPTV